MTKENKNEYLIKYNFEFFNYPFTTGLSASSVLHSAIKKKKKFYVYKYFEIT